LTLTSIPKLQTPSSDIFKLDKVAHFGVYLVFAYLLVKIHRSDQKILLRKLLLLALLIPVLDEVHQIPIPGREFSLYDIIADMAGFAVIFVLTKAKRISPARA